MGRMSKIMLVVLCFGVALTIGFSKSATGGEGSQLNCMHPDTMRTKLGEALDKIFKKGINKEACQFNLADQLKSINEVKVDLETEIPMDRLLCGDVGYGKTEVALRAAFKSVMDGKQVIILVPTTILA